MPVTLARVKGNVISTHKNSELKGYKLLITQAVDLEGNYIGNSEIVAIDFQDAGIGDVVLITQEGDAVQQILGHSRAPVHSIIVAVVDQIDYKKDSVRINA